MECLLSVEGADNFFGCIRWWSGKVWVQVRVRD